jgi:hypothetical protein
MEQVMKQITLIVMAAFALALTPVASAANDTKSITIQVSIAAEASIVLPGTTSLTAGATAFSDFTGSTTFTYKVRTSKTGGSGAVTFQIAEFSPSGGPRIAGGPAADNLKYSSSTTGVGSAQSTAQSVNSITTNYTVLSFAADAKSSGSGDTATVNWTLPNDPQYSTGNYSATATFTISAL